MGLSVEGLSFSAHFPVVKLCLFLPTIGGSFLDDGWIRHLSMDIAENHSVFILLNIFRRTMSGFLLGLWPNESQVLGYWSSIRHGFYLMR